MNFRKKLIEGSRGILQGTSSLLLCFDESEVRKIIRECKRVLDYLAVTEVIETMEDLMHFLKNLSPCLSKVSREVSAREKELTHQVHREILVRCLDQVFLILLIFLLDENISLEVSKNFSKKLYPNFLGDFRRFFYILSEFLGYEYLWCFIHTFRENTISFLKNIDFLVSCKFREY